ncbi:MAG: nitroreductase/quinone reductase family protein [Chloroflexota bacterium]|nr:nitroreductase/quinone reductase family protein [Chloroflexota bacterium]
MRKLLYFKSITWFSNFHRLILSISRGRWMRRLNGLDMLLVCTKGRKTGKIRKTPLLYIQLGNIYYSAASYGGNDSHPDWYLNILMDADVVLLVEKKWVKAIAKIEVGASRSYAWTKLTDNYPGFENYQNKTSRLIPVVSFHVGNKPI